ncbi:hypothetical protein BDW68DRAFT_45898 [Aspergillus falconensis]
MPRSSLSRSFTSSSLPSTSTSSSAARSLRNPSTLRLKRWFSAHLQLPLSRHSADSGTLYNNGSPQYALRNSVAKASITNTDIDTDPSGTQPSPTVKIPHGLSSRQHRFTGFGRDYEYPDGGDRYGHGNYSGGPHRHHRHNRGRYPAELGNGNRAGGCDYADEDEEDVVLADSYAAFCRAFTSSPVHFHNVPARPLPRLPTSETWEEYQGSLVDADVASAERVSQISFLPVGAYGYRPASWVLPGPPSPPPGILTPARYEIQQQREMAKLEKVKQKRKRLTSTWCLPICFSCWPWGRTKQA